MVQLLETFNRLILAVLSGGMIIFGTAFFADTLAGGGRGFQEIIDMVGHPSLRLITVVMTGVTAYIIGIINVAASNLVFSAFLASKTDDELLLISRIEALARPQLLKEIVDVLNVKRTLVAFTFPLFFFGVALATNGGTQWPTSPAAQITAGILLAAAGALLPLLAARTAQALDTSAKRLARETPAPARAATKS